MSEKQITTYEWVKALESDEWKQTRGKLRDGEAYCAMGVGNQLCQDSPIDPKVWGDFLSDWPKTEAELDAWLDYGRFSPEVDGESVWRWNDLNRLTFKEIASKIRKEFQKRTGKDLPQ